MGVDLLDVRFISLPSGHKRARYRAWCNTCGISKGYVKKQHGLRNKNCLKCSRIDLFTEEVRQKMSNAKLGHTPHNKGIKTSDRTKQIQRLRRLGKSPVNKGTAMSLEQRRKLSCIAAGIKEENFKGFYSNSARYEEDVNYRLTCVLRSRLNQSIRNCQKSGSAVRDLGCSIEELKSYLESKFQPGMAWDNWSKTGWHIDHIVALSRFDLSNPEELKKACHYTNLQPLWAKDNLRKSNKILS